MTIFDSFRLNGKRALITGGTRGLGLAMGHALAQAGADLVIVSQNPENLISAQKELLAHGNKVNTLEADFYKAEAVEEMCERALGRHGPIHILINNVGGRRENIALENQALADWQRLMDFNLTSTVICTRKIGSAMVPRKWGRVINIGSICGEIAGRSIHGRHYETAKAAVAGFTRAMAADWAPHGVTVNAIAPGPFLTDANKRWFQERPEFQPQVEGQIPMGRLGEPHELGPLALYLAGDASSFMTGAVLTIDGGYTLW
jgi:gluconate 5-dehydrogenase